MKTLFTALALCFTLIAQAQNDAVTKLFNEYYNNENFTKISVSSKMFELFTDIKPGDADEQEILDAISKLKGLKVIATDSVANSAKLYSDAVKKISGSGYEEL